MKHFFCIILLLALLTPVRQLHADFFPGSKFRLFGGYAFLNHETDFDSIPGIISPFPKFPGNNDGNGFLFGIAYELPLPQKFFFGLKISASGFDAVMKAKKSSDVLTEGKLTSGIFEQKLTSNFFALKFNSYFKYYVIDGLAVNFGGYFSPLLSQKYKYSERVISPDGAVFPENNLNYRNKKSASYYGKKGLTSGINFGISYDIPLNHSKTLFVSPELDYFKGLEDIFDYAGWKISSTEATISFTYSLKPKKKKITVPKTVFVNDTINMEHPDILYSEFHRGKTDTLYSNEELPDSIIKIQTISRTDTVYKKFRQKIEFSVSPDSVAVSQTAAENVFRILNRIYFVPGTAQILNYYSSEPKQLSNLYQVNSGIFNTIAKDLNHNKTDKIILRASTVSKSDSANKKIFSDRIRALTNRLISAGISPNRISSVENKETAADKRNDSVSDAENCFVEIYSDNPEILSPMSVKTNETNANPASVFISTAGSKISSVKSAKLLLAQNNIVLDSVNFDTFPSEFTYNFADNLLNRLNLHYPLQFTLAVATSNNDNVVETKELYFKEGVRENILRLSLFLFDFADAAIPTEQRNEISQFLANAAPNAEVKISGYCDNTGSAEFNKALSQRRAENAAEIIRSLRPDLKIIATQGFGSNKFAPGISSYSSAPERILSRTVIIDINK